MRSTRLLPFSLLLASAGLMTFTAHCGGGGDDNGQPSNDTGVEGDAVEEGGSEVGDSAPDATPDTPPPTITCSKAPVFHPPVRVNHNPDSLRRVDKAGMVLLDDGRLMVAMLEAVDTGTRYGVWARTVDPAAGKASDDERLDVDADNLTAGSGFRIFSIPGGAVGVAYGGSHLKVYSKGKWSPDLATVGSFSVGELAYLAAPSGQVLVTRVTGSAAPYIQATVYRPDEGGAKGSWSTLQPLDLDGASGPGRVDRLLLPDGRFMTMIWQGAGGPAIRIRSLSGSWSTPFAKAEIGSTDTVPSYRLLDDGSIVLVALEPTGETRRAVTSTWTATDGWSTSRLLSKPTPDTNGVMPGAGSPFLFSVSGNELEYVAWVAACAGVTKDCEYHAISRRYAGGSWKDPVDLGIGETGRLGPDGTNVYALDGSTPIIARTNEAKTQIDFRVRNDATTFKPIVTLGKDSPYFGDGTQIGALFYGGWQGIWALTTRTNVPTSGAPTQLPTAIGKIDPTADKVTWGLVTAGSYELRGFGSSFPYALGSGGFAIGVNDATDGTNPASPIIAYVSAAGGSPESAPAISSDEKSASFVNVPRVAPRLNRDRSAIYVVSAPLTDPAAAGNRLRAYAFNGVGTTVPKVLANESRAPRAFGDGLVTYGCGGAILYAVDPVDGSHGLEVVFVKEDPVGG